jgi:hypothetical protein
MTTDQPKVMHALKTELAHPLVPGAFYETLCGTSWEHQPIPKEEARTRFVCAACYSAQIEELRRILNNLVAWAWGEQPNPPGSGA